MTKQEQNEIILRHISSEVQEKPEVAERIGSVFARWFQNLVQLASQQPVNEEQPPIEGEPTTV